MTTRATAIRFCCRGDELVGVIDTPDRAVSRGALVVVGGPQYRAGSHRQFTLLARSLSAAGYPVMRFDHRGIGDSDGDAAGFELLDHDIRSAVDAFAGQLPALRQIVLVGLCDAASAAMMYVPTDDRIAGLVLLNPWVRSEAGLARSTIKQYYGRQILSRAFWGRLLRGDVKVGAAVRSLVSTVGRALSPGAKNATEGPGPTQTRPFQERMRQGLEAFDGPVLCVLSGDDLTATEFDGLVRSSRSWRRLMNRPAVTVQRLPSANHTFSRRAWRDQVAAWTAQWMGSW